ncbi:MULTISPECIES: ABC transporter permease [unclassified Rathayibacter]|uniref:ABC transporter permease n=1 Tax=unclassified Rathayibacter TaxID=2609250 RepID=UPI000CE828D1|nr:MULTISPECIES: ABC transporter permease subunit [unclassified Rathayibacter]PPG09680.1 nitrate ABC transporter permease [Rathayibacter sp. AY2B1]PPG69629.1 nitrate ABC transporter permease [Rathayibacter sp. AY1F4]
MSTTALARSVLAPLVLGIAAVLLWQAGVTALAIQPFVLPSPLAIGQEFAANLGSVAEGSAVTGRNALVGLLVGAVLAVVVAGLSALARVFDGLVAPIVAAAAVVPIVALAPVLYTMFGANAETARQLVAALAVFVPVYVTTLRGLRQAAPVHRDLLKAYAATPWQTARTITLPGAVPYVFTGLRIASSLAVISALVAEYFGGPVGGLGKSITTAASGSDYTLAYAYVLGAVVVGLVFYSVTAALEAFALRRSRLR